MARFLKPAVLIPSGGVAVGLFCLYLPFLQKTVSWAAYSTDGGDFLAAALTGGIPHPSGYPTYILLLRLFLNLPFSSPYWRGAFLSAACTALAGGLLCLWVQNIVLEKRAWGWAGGVAAGLVWGSAPLVWLHAVIVEVYALQSLLVVLFLWWFALLRRKTWNLWIAALSFGMGLALGSHLTFFLLLPAALINMIGVYRKGFPLARLTLLFLFGMCGLGVYLYLPLAARTYPAVNWGNPQTWNGFWWEISAAPYQSMLFSAAPVTILARIPAWVRMLLDQFSILGLILGVCGAVLSDHIDVYLRSLLVWIAAAFSLFAIFYQGGDSAAYLLPAYLAWAVWIGVSVERLLAWRWRGAAAGAWTVSLLALLLVARIPSTIRAQNPSQDVRAAQFIESYLQAAPAGAFLITTSDLDTFALWYAHFGLKERPDLRVFVEPLAQYGWYRENMAHVYTDLKYPPETDELDWLQDLLQANPTRPVCRSTTLFPSGATDDLCQ